MLELVEKNRRVGRGRGERTEAVGEWRGRREEVIKTSHLVEREPVAGGRRQLVTQLLVREEPGLAQSGLTEDQSLVTGGRRLLVEDAREMFGSGKSQLLAVAL